MSRHDEPVTPVSAEDYFQRAEELAAMISGLSEPESGGRRNLRQRILGRFGIGPTAVDPITVSDNAAYINILFEKMDEATADALTADPSEETVLQALDLESRRAELVHNLGGRKPKESQKLARSSLSKWATRSLHEGLSRTESELQRQERLDALERLSNQVAALENNYTPVTANELREQPIRLQLKRHIIDKLVDPGSQLCYFNDTQARVILRLISSVRTAEQMDSLRNTLYEVNALQQAAYKLHGRVASNLFESLGKLQEIHETGLLDRFPELQPVTDWVEAFIGVTPAPLEEPPAQTIEVEEPAPYDPSEGLDAITARLGDKQERLEIEPFPPNKVSKDGIIEDFERYVKQHPQTKYVVEVERIAQLIDLYERFLRTGYNVHFYRTNYSHWHPLPYYAIELRDASVHNQSMVIMESPIYGNASYLIEDNEWQEIVRSYSRTETKLFGAEQFVHPSDQPGGSDYHINRLHKAVRSRLP